MNTSWQKVGARSCRITNRIYRHLLTFPEPLSSPLLISDPALVDPSKLGADNSVVAFLSSNNTLVTAHAGSTVTLACVVRRESQFGMVSTCPTSQYTVDMSSNMFGMGTLNRACSMLVSRQTGMQRLL